MAYAFFTIGHFTRTVSQFVDLLQASQIEFVVHLSGRRSSALTGW